MKVVWMGKAHWILPSCKIWHYHINFTTSKKIVMLKSLSHRDTQPASQPYVNHYTDLFIFPTSQKVVLKEGWFLIRVVFYQELHCIEKCQRVKWPEGQLVDVNWLPLHKKGTTTFILAPWCTVFPNLVENWTEVPVPWNRLQDIYFWLCIIIIKTPRKLGIKEELGTFLQLPWQNWYFVGVGPIATKGSYVGFITVIQWNACKAKIVWFKVWIKLVLSKIKKKFS